MSEAELVAGQAGLRTVARRGRIVASIWREPRRELREDNAQHLGFIVPPLMGARPQGSRLEILEILAVPPLN